MIRRSRLFVKQTLDRLLCGWNTPKPSNFLVTEGLSFAG
jgi:hypothetical protein